MEGERGESGAQELDLYARAEPAPSCALVSLSISVAVPEAWSPGLGPPATPTPSHLPNPGSQGLCLPEC